MLRRGGREKRARKDHRFSLKCLQEIFRSDDVEQTLDAWFERLLMVIGADIVHNF